MLPPGHLAGGYLTAQALLKIVKPDLPEAELRQLLYWGLFFSVAPDLDTFVSFAMEKAFFVKDQRHNHRKFLSHAPLLWLFASLLVYCLSSSEFGRVFGLIILTGSFTHFILDSIEYGIMWLWPFSKKVFALKNPERNFDNPYDSFWQYWIYFVKQYSKTLTFFAEILIIVSFLLFFITNH